jgi:hypothetical protein
VTKAKLKAPCIDTMLDDTSRICKSPTRMKVSGTGRRWLHTDDCPFYRHKCSFSYTLLYLDWLTGSA